MCQTQFLRPWKSVKNGVNTEFFILRKRKKSFLHWKLKVCENCTINFVVLTKDDFTSFRKSVKTFCIAHSSGSVADPLQTGKALFVILPEVYCILLRKQKQRILSAGNAHIYS